MQRIFRLCLLIRSALYLCPFRLRILCTPSSILLPSSFPLPSSFLLPPPSSCLLPPPLSFFLSLSLPLSFFHPHPTSGIRVRGRAPPGDRWGTSLSRMAAHDKPPPPVHSQWLAPGRGRFRSLARFGAVCTWCGRWCCRGCVGVVVWWCYMPGVVCCVCFVVLFL